MYLDAQNSFSDAQAVTATAASTNYIDLAPLTGTARNIGVGDDLYIHINIDVALTDSGSDSTVAITLETDDNTSFSSATTLATVASVAATAAAGTSYIYKIASAAFERYIQLRYTVSGGNLTTGSFTAGIVKDAQQYTSYADNIVIS